jgi:hypothetical protein
MTELKDLPLRLKTLSQSEWSKLFDLIPEIEKTISFGKLSAGVRDESGINVFPSWQASPIVDRFCKVAYELNIIAVFDWSSWDEGYKILADPKGNFELLDAVTLCKLITLIVRADRFNDGVLIGCFESGTMTKITLALKNKFFLPAV